MAAPPANDSFSGAQAIAGSVGSVLTSNADATKEVGEPNHAGNAGGASIWFRWTAPRNGRITLDTELGALDTLLAVYQGTSVSSLSLVAQDDDSGIGSTSKLTFLAVSGTVYSIAVDGFDAKVGTTELRWVQNAENDNLSDAFPITGIGGTVTGTTEASTRETGEPSHGDPYGYGSVWYSWIAPRAGRTSFVWPNFNVRALGIYTGATVNTLTAVGKRTRFGLVLRTSAGTRYWIAVAGYPVGQFKLSWLSTPANDNFGAAARITRARGRVTGSTVGATRELHEPSHFAYTGEFSIWYRWRAPRSGRAVFETYGSSFDTVLAAYTGTSLGRIRALDKNNNGNPRRTSRVVFAVRRGAVYRIAVAGYYQSMGRVILSWHTTSR
jgi:hypothetical protein